MPFYIDVLLYMTTVSIHWNTVFFCAVRADRHIPSPPRTFNVYQSLSYPVMPHNILPVLQNILLICSLPGVIVMDDIRHTVLISAIGDDAYMIFEHDNIPALPFFYRGNICREAYGGMGKVNPQIFHTPYPSFG